MENALLTYRFGTHEYNTLADAQKACLEIFDVRVFIPRFNDQCDWHGDSLVGLDETGRELCEIKFLENHNFCNAPEGCCGYKSTFG